MKNLKWFYLILLMGLLFNFFSCTVQENSTLAVYGRESISSSTLPVDANIALIAARLIHDNTGGPFTVKVTGDLVIKNLNYHKTVHAVYWNSVKKNWLSVPALYVKSIENNQEIWRFEIPYEYYGFYDQGVEFRFAFSYAVNGAVYWDNNSGKDYRLTAAASDTPFFADHVIGRTGIFTRESSLTEDGQWILNVQVENLAYHKKIQAVYSSDRWKTVLTADLFWQKTLPNGQEVWSLSKELPPGTEQVEFAVKAEMAGKIWWDNFYGDNHRTLKSSYSYAVRDRVRLIYWVPSDRDHLSQQITSIRNLVTGVRDFYREEMALAGIRNNQGIGKTFTLETDVKGDPRIWLIRGDHPLSWYQNQSSRAEFMANDEIYRKISLEFFRSNVVVCFVETWSLENGEVKNSGNWGQGISYQGGVIQGTHVLGIGFRTAGNDRNEQTALFSDNNPSGIRDWSPDETGYRYLTRGEYASVAVGVFAHELGHALGGLHLTDMNPPETITGTDQWLMQNGFRRFRNRYSSFEGYPTKIHPRNIAIMKTSAVMQ